MKNEENQNNKGFFAWIERVGNKLPHPVVIFIILAAIVMIVSAIAEQTGLTLTYADPTGQQATVVAKSLLSVEGINHVFNSAVDNFTGFAPLGTVLVIVMGVGVAEWTGLIENTLKKLLSNVSGILLSAAVVFAGIISNLASDVGYVVVIPLGAIIFAAAGRNPIAGLVAAFAGVSGGFSANLFPGPTDALLVGITNEALSSSNIPLSILVTSNWYFLIASTIVLTIAGALVTDKVIEPRLGKYTGDYTPTQKELSADEKRGLRNALISLVVFILIMTYLLVDIGLPFSGLFQTIPEDKTEKSIEIFLQKGLLFAIFLLFAIPGYVYGKTVGKIKNSNDLIKGMEISMQSMASYIVLAFFAAQLINYFNYTNLGTIIAISGANFLEAINLKGLPLIGSFVLVASFINLFMGSASAKWAILAPIFIPMFYNLGIEPEMTQMAYRIADSSTNVISPLMAYFPMILIYLKRYDKKAGIGTLVSNMLTYSLVFLLVWTVLLVIWNLFNLPLGQMAVNLFI